MYAVSETQFRCPERFRASQRAAFLRRRSAGECEWGVYAMRESSYVPSDTFASINNNGSALRRSGSQIAFLRSALRHPAALQLAGRSGRPSAARHVQYAASTAYARPAYCAI